MERGCRLLLRGVCSGHESGSLLSKAELDTWNNWKMQLATRGVELSYHESLLAARPGY